MLRAKRQSEERAEGGTGPALPPLGDLFDSYVCRDVESPDERRAQAVAIGGLVAGGIVAAGASPLAFILGLGPAGVLAATLTGGALLASAAFVSATARLNTTLAALLATLAGSAGAAILAGGAFSILGGAGLLASAAGSLLLGRRLGRGRAARTRAAVPESAGQRAERLLTGPLLRFDATGRLTDAPKDADQPFGLPGPNGAVIVDRIHVLDRVAFLEAFADLRRGAPTAELELRVSTPAGQRQLALRLAAVTGPDGEVTEVLGLARDLTEEREATHELTRTLTHAQGASEAKSRFLAAISHELRTPLNAIIGFADILEQEYFGGFESPRQKEYVGLIGRSGDHLLQVVNGLLDLSKIEAGHYEIAPETFAPREAMENAAAMVRGEAEAKRLVLIVQEPEDELPFRADRRAFHQILLNLLSNAVKFTDEGCVRISARREGHLQIVEVEDSGIGIAAYDLALVAQPFARVGALQDRPGTGLGLSLAKGLCELHGGTLTLESRPGHGTIVIVSIPDECAAIGQDNFKEKIVSLTDARKKTVILPSSPAGRRTA